MQNRAFKKIVVGKSISIESLIHVARGQKVILDSDLAKLYGVETKALNQAVKRNKRRFPKDFTFLLKRFEAEEIFHSRSQFVTLKRGTNIKHLPYVFTEHGAIMAANVLRSRRAVDMSIFVVRAFMRMRMILSGHKGLMAELKALEKKLTGRLDSHEVVIVDILKRMMDLLNPPPRPLPPPKRPIGFHI